MSRTSRLLLPLTVAAALALTVSACSSGAPEAPPTATETVTETATPTPSSPPTSFPTATPGPDGASGGGGDLGDGATGAVDDRCRASELTGSITDGGGAGGGGAAGSYGVAIVLTNTGDRTCELQGWPGVSFVGDGNGSQVGAAATLDRSSAHDTVSFAPGGEAQVIVELTQAGNYDPAECEPRSVDGFRVYPPGSVEALFVPAGGDLFTACANAAVQQLSVGAVQAF